MKESWFAQHIHGDRESDLFGSAGGRTAARGSWPVQRYGSTMCFTSVWRAGGSDQFRGHATALSARERASWFRPGKWSPFGLTRKEPWKLIWVGFTGCRAAEYLGPLRPGEGEPGLSLRCPGAVGSAVSRRWSAVRCWAGAMNFFCLESCTAFWAGSPALLRGRAAGAGKPGLSM